MDYNEITLQCIEEYHAGLQFKQGRIKDWQLTEDQYFGKVQKSIKSRFNVPLPIMSGFVDTLLSKIDEPPALKFESHKESEYMAVEKAQSLYEQISSSEDADWDSKDLDGKKLAIFYGRSIHKYFAESSPKYKSNFICVDPYDFNCDPMGGGDLENHRFMSQDCILKSKEEILEGVKQGMYDGKQAQKILLNAHDNKNVDNDNMYRNKLNRFAALNLDNQT